MLLIGPPNLGPYSSEDMVITGHLFGELGLQSTSSYAIAMATADLFPVGAGLPPTCYTAYNLQQLKD